MKTVKVSRYGVVVAKVEFRRITHNSTHTVDHSLDLETMRTATPPMLLAAHRLDTQSHPRRRREHSL